MMVFIARALCPSLYGIGSSTSSFESLPLRIKRKNSTTRILRVFFLSNGHR